MAELSGGAVAQTAYGALEVDPCPSPESRGLQTSSPNPMTNPTVLEAFSSRSGSLT